MKIILEYISMNYMTLMLLAWLAVILIVNRRMKIEGISYIYAITGLVFVLTLVEYMEVWCNNYDKPIWILYIKAALSYIIHPLMILLAFYFVAPIKHKVLLFLPLLTESVFIISDLFGTKLIYSYSENHVFHSGNFHFLTVLSPCFYILLLMIYSLRFLHHKEYSKTVIVIFMAISTIITVLLETAGIIIDHTTEIATLEIIVYYFYLAAIHHSEVQERLHSNEIELAESKQAIQEQKVRLLIAQIQPHFIYNSLMALQAKSIGNPVVYDGLQNFGSYLRSNFMAMADNELIPFKNELKCIKAYLALEQLNYGERMRVQYDIEIDCFMVPALSIEPLVENAIRYGIGTYEEGGLVQIIVRDEPEYIEIEVRDDGSGGNKLTDMQKKRKSIGLENVRLRLQTSGIGKLTLSQDETGTSAIVRLNYMEVQNEDDYD